MKSQAVAYFRFSSKVQATGNSELRQETGFGEFVARSGLAQGPTYIDRGESAFHDYHRGGDFGRLLADCASKKFPAKSVVWFEDMDRFGRGKLGVVLSDWLTITSAGYGIHISSLGQTFTEDTDQMEMMGVIMKSILAHDESKKKSVRGKAARKRIRETGRTKPKVEGEKGRKLAACPFWLTVGADGEYHENDYAKLVKEMFRLSALGFGAGEISNELGNPTRPVTRTIDRKKVKVNATIDVLGVLRNRAVIGEKRETVRTGKSSRKETGEVKEGYYPAVVSVELFNEVQFGLDGRRKQRGRKGVAVSNLFTELFIGSDGLPMYLACGEIKGGIDPAGADEHWKTANSALGRIREVCQKGGKCVHLFFAGAAIENSMAEEIFAQLKSNQLEYGANLTSMEQTVDLAEWLISL